MPSPIPSSRMQVYAQLFYPGVSQLSVASPIDLGAGQEVEADFSLTAEPTYKVAGAFTGLDDIPSGTVFKRQAGEDFDFVRKSLCKMADLRLKFPLVHTPSRLTPRKMKGHRPASSFITVLIVMFICANSGTSIPVIIRTDSDGNLERVEDSKAHTMVGVRLHRMSSTPSLYTREFWWTGPQASEISYVEAGRYEVELSTFGKWRVESAKCGGIDLLNNDLTVIAGSQPAAVEITLRNDARRLQERSLVTHRITQPYCWFNHAVPEISSRRLRPQWETFASKVLRLVNTR